MKLADIRFSLNLSQQELADAIGSQQATICRWESGKQKPRARQRRRIVAVLMDLGYEGPVTWEVRDA